MTVSSRAVTLAVLLGAGVASAQAVVPKDWQRLAAAQMRNAEIVSCVGQRGGAMFGVKFDGPLLSATVMKKRSFRHDAVPYELDWGAALSGMPGLAVLQGGADWAIAYAREQAETSVVHVDDGYLIGFGAGEYGGSLWWYPRKPGPGRVLARTGIAHLTINDGSALWVERSEGQWQVRREVSVPGSPQVHVARPDRILMADRAALTLLAWNGDLRTLQRFSLGAIATSFAFGPVGEIAVGRSVIVSLLRPTSAGGYVEQVYRPKECRKFTSDGSVCMCSGAPL